LASIYHFDESNSFLFKDFSVIFRTKGFEGSASCSNSNEGVGSCFWIM